MDCAIRPVCAATTGRPATPRPLRYLQVTAATVEIDKANQIQKKSRAMLCIYLLLLLCGAMVLVLVVKKSMGG